MNALEYRAVIETLKATGKKVNGCEFGEEFAPEYTGKVYGNDGLVRLPDGRLAFAIEDQCGSHTGLYAEAISMDAGDNIIRVRKADDGDSLAGISAPVIPHTSIHLTTVGRKLIGWLK